MTTDIKCTHSRFGNEALFACNRHGALLTGSQCLDCSVFRLYTRYEHTASCEVCRRGLLVSQYCDRVLRRSGGHPANITAGLSTLVNHYQDSPLEQSAYRALAKILDMVGYPPRTDVLPDDHILKEIFDALSD